MLNVQRSVCVECGTFVLKDTTGYYNETDNPGGYGTPNPAFGDATPYTVSLYAPKANEPAYTLDLNLEPPEPDAEGHYTYVVTKDMLGFVGKELPSGIWKVVFTMGIAKDEQVFFADGDIKAKISKCICCSGPKNSVLMLDLMAAKELCKCFKYDEAQKLIDQLYRDAKNCCDCGCN